MRLKSLLIISAVTTLVMILIMYLQGAPLKTPVTPSGILDLEFAGKVARATEVVDAWKPHLISIANKNTLIDFLFLISYGCLLYAASLSLSKTRSGVGRWPGIIAARFALIAAAFDAIENILMFRTLAGSIQKEMVASTFMFASAKFLLVTLAILYILISLVSLSFRRRAAVKNLMLK